jgi:hypothetical protein
MPVTDPIADMLTRIRNAVHLRREAVNVRSSKIVISIAEARGIHFELRNHQEPQDAGAERRQASAEVWPGG